MHDMGQAQVAMSLLLFRVQSSCYSGHRSAGAVWTKNLIRAVKVSGDERALSSRLPAAHCG